jgi:ribonucleoside-diphosphate reductase alpha chain
MQFSCENKGGSMLLSSESVSSSSVSAIHDAELSKSTSSSVMQFDQYKVIRRNGSVVPFEPTKISIAMTKAFIAVNGGQGAASARVREMVEHLTSSVVAALVRRQPNGGTLHIEDLQDQVELSLMRSGEHDVARSYVLYREDRTRERAKGKKEHEPAFALNVKENGVLRPLDVKELTAQIESACEGLGDAVNPQQILSHTLKDLYDGVPLEEVRKCTILSARSL